MGGAGFTHAEHGQRSRTHRPATSTSSGNSEDEPGTFKDRYLLEHTPREVIEGCADRGDGHARQPRRPVRQSAPGTRARDRPRGRAAVARPHCSRRWNACSAAASLMVVASSGLYIGGEETAVIASIEGRFPVPAPQAAVPCPAGRCGTDRHQQHRDACPCPGNPAARRAVVSRPGHRAGQRHQALFALRRRVASGPVRAADGHAARGTRLRA